MHNGSETNPKALGKQYTLLLDSICSSVTSEARRLREKEDKERWKEDEKRWDGQALWAFCCDQKRKELEDKLAADDKLPAWSTMTKMGSSGVTKENAEAFVRACIDKNHGRSVKDFLDGFIVFVESSNKFQIEKIKSFEGFDDLIEKVIARWKIEKAIEDRKKSEDFPEEDAIELKSPFKSLNHFDFDDAEHFFGRREETADIVTNIDNVAFYALMGASGTGKSSLALAGVAFELVRTNTWEYLSLRVSSPSLKEKRPFYALIGALLKLHSPGLQGAELEESKQKMADMLSGKEGAAALVQYIDTVCQNIQGKRLLLIIDQFEELFTKEVNEEDRKGFLDLLVSTQQKLKSANPDGKPRACFLLTIRSDFQEQFNPYSDFTNLISNNHHHRIITPISTKDQVADVICLPLEDSPVAFEEGLSERLVEDAVTAIKQASHSNVIPLLQYTLAQLWENKETITITFQSYLSMGGLFGALPNKANDFIKKLGSEAEKETVKDIFLRLVDWIETSDNGKFSRQLSYRGRFGNKEWEIIKKLAGKEYRLLTISGNKSITKDVDDGDVTVEISHESLLSEWDLLADWLQPLPEFIKWRNQIRDKINDWEKNDRRSDYLLTKPYLEEAQRWRGERKLADDENYFLNASLECHDQISARKKIIKKSITLGFIFLVVALSGFGFYSYYLSTEIVDEMKKSSINKKLYWSEKARDLLSSGETRLAILLALNVIDETEELENLDRPYNNSIELLNEAIGKHVESDVIEFSEDVDYFDVAGSGEYLAVASKDGSVLVKDVNSGYRYFFEMPEVGELVGIDFFNNGNNLLLSISDDEYYFVYDVNTPELMRIDERIFDEPVIGYEEDRDRGVVIRKSMSGKINLNGIDFDIFSEGDKDDIGLDYYYDSENGVFSAFGDRGIIRLNFNNDNNNRLETFFIFDKYSGYSLNKNATALCAKNFDLTIECGNALNVKSSTSFSNIDTDFPIKLSSFNKTKEEYEEARNFSVLSVSDSGRYVGAGSGGHVSIFDLRTGREIQKLMDSYSELMIPKVYFSHDDSMFLSQDWDGGMHLWDTAHGSVYNSFRGGEGYPYWTVSNDHFDRFGFLGRTKDFYSFSKFDQIRIYRHIHFPQGSSVFDGYGKTISSFDIDQNLQLLVIGYKDGTVKIWDVDDYKLIDSFKLDGNIENIQISHDQRKVIFTFSNAKSIFWDIENSMLSDFITSDLPLKFVGFSNDDSVVMAVSWEGMYNHLWFYLVDEIGNGDSFNYVGEASTHETYIDFFLNNGSDFKDQMWEANQFKCVSNVTDMMKGSLNIEGKSVSIGCEAMSTNFELFAVFLSYYTPNDDGKYATLDHHEISFRRLADRELVDTIRSDVEISSMGFSFDSTQFFTQTEDEILIYNMEDTSTPVVKWKSIENIRKEYSKFSPDGKLFLQVDSDSRVVIRSVETGNVMFEYDHSVSEIEVIRFSSDSKNIIWSDASGKISIFPIIYFSDDDVIQYFKSLRIPEMTEEEKKTFQIQG
tara:strand:- start:14934 stop:19439 length:4506 start_codon:yes stop_codon:yes gene_type:complete